MIYVDASRLLSTKQHSLVMKKAAKAFIEGTWDTTLEALAKCSNLEDEDALQHQDFDHFKVSKISDVDDSEEKNQFPVIDDSGDKCTVFQLDKMQRAFNLCDEDNSEEPAIEVDSLMGIKKQSPFTNFFADSIRQHCDDSVDITETYVTNDFYSPQSFTVI